MQKTKKRRWPKPFMCRDKAVELHRRKYSEGRLPCVNCTLWTINIRLHLLMGGHDKAQKDRLKWELEYAKELNESYVT